MKTYIALLRGVNVSGKHKISMADLKFGLERLGLKDVLTYIQSGNIVFKSDIASTSYLEERIKKEINDSFGFDVPVLVMTRSDMENILQECPYKKTEDVEANRIYFVLLQRKPEDMLINTLKQTDYPNELFQVAEYCVYLNCTRGAGNAKLTNNLIERKLKVVATTRNHNTMVKLLALSQ